MSSQRKNNHPSAQGDGNGPKHASAARDISSGDEHYVTELDYIATWDVISYEPSDVFMNGMDAMFESGAFDVGEEYPRGV